MWSTRRALNVAILVVVLAGAAVAFQQNTVSFRLASTLEKSPLLKRPVVAQRPKPISPFRSITLLSTKAAGEEANAAKPVTLKNTFLAASLLIGLDIFFRRLLQTFAIGFPSALAGCGALFATFLLTPGGPRLYDILSPGAALLAKFLPLFFVPSLITLPLADSVGSVEDVSIGRPCIFILFIFLGGK